MFQEKETTMNAKKRISLGVLALLSIFAPSPARADSAMVAPNEGYVAEDLFSLASANPRKPEAFGAVGNHLAMYAHYFGLEIADPETETIIQSLGKPQDGYIEAHTDAYDTVMVSSSFIAADPSGDALWVGFTEWSNTDDRIYKVDLASGVWTHKASMAGNMDLEFFGNTAYISGLNSSNWEDPNCIWKLDTSGSDNHDKLIELTGNSAGLGVDRQGNIYYGTYRGEDNPAELFRWEAADVAGAVGSGHLTFAEATKLADLDRGVYDLAVDEVGNVVFDQNSSIESTVGLWDRSKEPGDDYEIIGTGGAGHWYTVVTTEGDVTAEGSALLTDYYTVGIGMLMSNSLRGDLNDDGFIGGDDLDLVRSYWGRNVPPADVAADPSGDGFVGGDDLDLVRANWGRRTPPAPSSAAAITRVPEPAAWILLMSLLGVGLAARRFH